MDGSEKAHHAPKKSRTPKQWPQFPSRSSSRLNPGPAAPPASGGDKSLEGGRSGEAPTALNAQTNPPSGGGDKSVELLQNPPEEGSSGQSAVPPEDPKPQVGPKGKKRPLDVSGPLPKRAKKKRK